MSSCPCCLPWVPPAQSLSDHVSYLYARLGSVQAPPHSHASSSSALALALAISGSGIRVTPLRRNLADARLLGCSGRAQPPPPSPPRPLLPNPPPPSPPLPSPSPSRPSAKTRRWTTKSSLPLSSPAQPGMCARRTRWAMSSVGRWRMISRRGSGRGNVVSGGFVKVSGARRDEGRQSLVVPSSVPRQSLAIPPCVSGADPPAYPFSCVSALLRLRVR